MNKITKLITTVMFVFACVVAWALPGTTAANLQTTTGVTTALNGSTLSITAPDKAVLTWQAFGSGAHAIGTGDTISYSLPTNKASVLNIVAGGASTTIDGYISSNGNVFVLNPNGILISGSARIDVNAFYASTSDLPAFASYYFQQNGALPSQANLATAAGSASIGNGAIINVTDNITILAKNVDVGGAIIQGGLNVTADGNVNLGTGGVTVINGNTVINNPTGVTTLGTVGGVFTTNNNVVVNATTGVISNAVGSSFSAKNLTVNAGTGDVSLGKVGSASITVTGNNVAVGVGQVVNPVVNVTANGTASITSPTSLTANIRNTSPTANTNVTSTGTLTLGTVHVNSAGNTSFTGSSVVDSLDNNFVYGPVLFNATAGDVAITKAGNSFGPVSVSTTGNATIYEGAALNLGTINVGKLIARTGDYSFQTGVITTPNLSIVAAKDITYSNAANAIGAFTATGANVSVATNTPVILNNVVTSGTLTVLSSNAITQATDTKVTSIGATGLTGTGITLANAGNKFGGLTVDVTAAGTATITEDTTLNLVSLRAANVVLKSLASVITTGSAAVVADSYNIEAANDVTLLSNFRATNPLTVKGGGVVDLSALSFSTNLNNKYPIITAPTSKAPTP